MKQLKIYESGDKMISLIKDNYDMLQSLGSFGINLGFGDKTVKEICEANGVDTYTFLAIVNFTINGYTDIENDDQLSVPTLLHYLEASHVYYLGYQLPAIRRELSECINQEDNLGKLIMKLYDEYAHDIKTHMMYEEQNLFPYVTALLEDQEHTEGYNIETFSKNHDESSEKLKELKILIIKYMPADAHNNSQLMATLHDIYNNEEWLMMHAMIEDNILVPAIRRLETLSKRNDVTKNISSMVFKTGTENSEMLSDRERDVIIALVQGMANKEIADHLCISINTVITHRRNIARKLQIHSPAGLTIYAIVNGLVDISSVKI